MPSTAAGQFRWVKFAGFIAAIATSFGVALAAPLLFHVQSRAAQLLSSPFAIYIPFMCVIGLAGLLCLLKYAELAVALFYVIGFFKGDPRLDAAPIDLTVAVAIVMIMAIAVRLCFTDQKLLLPREFIFYLPILALMFISLTYTPDVAAGLDKTLRFVFLTLLGAVSPFVLVDTPPKIRRFFAGLVLGGLLMAVNSFFKLGGEDRLTAPSGDTNSLGFSAGVALVVIWTLWFPRMSLFRRIWLYPAIAILVVALIGSGGRLANVGTVLCIGMSLLFCRKLFVDLGIILGAGIVALPFVRIPEASFEYIASLAHPHQAFGTRLDLMELGLRTFMNHPFFGVGIQGYRYGTPNPITYNFPHNLLLELGGELGIFAVVAFLLYAIFSYRSMFRVLGDKYTNNSDLYRTVFLMLVLTCMDASVSGEMNNDRLLFFALSMPFVLERIVWQEHSPRVIDLAGERMPKTPEPLESAFSN
jgi:O-antigen ligase